MLRSGQSVVDRTAVSVAVFVEVAHRSRTEVGEVVPKILEIVLAQDLRFAVIETPSHAREFYNVRFVFVLAKPNRDIVTI